MNIVEACREIERSQDHSLGMQSASLRVMGVIIVPTVVAEFGCEIYDAKTGELKAKRWNPCRNDLLDQFELAHVPQVV